MKKNVFRISEVPPGSVLLMAMWRCSASKGFLRHPSKCTHRQGPLSEGHIRRIDSDMPAARLTIQRADWRPTAKLGASTFRSHLLSKASDV